MSRMDMPSVLIVDDDRTSLRLCERILERGGFEVQGFSDPVKALAWLEQHPVDMLLTDIRMPGMDGFELIDSAKKKQQELAVVIMTSFASVETAIQAMHKDADGLIIKPFPQPSDLHQTVMRTLRDVRRRRDAARIELLRPLFDLTASLLADTNITSLEVRVMDAVEQLLRVQHAGVFMLEGSLDETSDLKVVMKRNLPDPEDTIWQKLLGFIVTQPAELLVLQPTTLTMVEQRHYVTNLEWEALLAITLSLGSARYFFVAAKDAGQGMFTNSDEELLTILARQTLVALDNARLYTDLRDSVQRIAESQKALIQAEKMAAVGRLMATLAHEINNPLQSVRNCLHLAGRPDISNEQKMVYLNMTNTELDRLVGTIRQMLDFYRPGQREKDTFPINEAIERTLQILEPQITSRSIEVNLALPSDLGVVYGFRDQLQQVFFNLLMNAVDATEGLPDKQVWVDGELSEGETVVRVEDSGRGIPPEMSNRLFEPFVSTKSQGTGLGLSVSYGIVESLGGRLRLVRPFHGNGACFEVMIPQEHAGSRNGQSSDR